MLSKHIHWLYLSVLTLGLSTSFGCSSKDETPATTKKAIRVLSYNIGNPDSKFPNYEFRMRDQDLEDFMGKKIRDLNADIVFLQEVLPADHCASFTETDAKKTCYQIGTREPPVRRILGPDYTIICDKRKHVECVGVKKALGTIVGFSPGAYQIDGAETPPLPLAECSYVKENCDDSLCDIESTVSAVTVKTSQGDLRLVHAHPNAPGTGSKGAYLGEPCRRRQFQQVFEGLSGFGDLPLVGTTSPVIVGGDFNVDMDKSSSKEEKELFGKHVGKDKKFTDFSQRDGTGTYFGTRRGAFGLAIDHVLASSSTTGKCEVRGSDSFGPENPLPPMDHDFDWSKMANGENYSGRLDHFAVICDLTLDFAK